MPPALGRCSSGLLLLCAQCSRRQCSTNAGSIKLGNVTATLLAPKHRHLVPHAYVEGALSQSTLSHMRWLLQKEQLGQDVFLIGVPGSTRRRLLMQYLELTGREYEYLCITRDTTEADIKQRREIHSGTAYYSDLCAVRAALQGRVLVLDGVEKAERNVLPILNNLLENREMQLDDGRFLVAAHKYDKLAEQHSPSELSAMQLERVSERFHVIALGLPVPRFRGHTLDPPFRSRFQCRFVQPPTVQEHLAALQSLAPNVDNQRLMSLISFAYGSGTEEMESVGVPVFPIDSLPAAAVLWNLNPSYSVHEIIQLFYPYDLLLKTDGKDLVLNSLQGFDIRADVKSGSRARVQSIEPSDKHENKQVKEATIEWDAAQQVIPVATGTASGTTAADDYVPNAQHDRLLAQLVAAHSVGDFALIGPKGCGKTRVIAQLADLLGYEADTMMLYQDMTSRDLVQQRRMLPTGDTVWQASALVEAAADGRCCVLDGLHRLHHSTLNVLQRLIVDRELELFDGSRYIGAGRYEAMKHQLGVDDQYLSDKRVYRIHPSFRLIGIGEPPNVNDAGGQWLTPELMCLWPYYRAAPLDAHSEMHVVSSLVPELDASIEQKLIDFVGTMRASKDNSLVELAASLSTRQIVRIMNRSAHYKREQLYDQIHRACLSRFLPTTSRLALNAALDRAGIRPTDESQRAADAKTVVKCSVEDDGQTIRIGSTTATRFSPESQAMVPDIVYYDNVQHNRVLEDMLKDWQLGEHILLIGNQGVGKNKVADRFLQLLNRPRQYIQLHRDTTVSTLTLQATVVDGVVVYEDSPLVKAAKYGHVLVIDEGDKAPTHVTCVLKLDLLLAQLGWGYDAFACRSLVESGHMHLADGRAIRPSKGDTLVSSDANTIHLHPDFRVIVLANRPGYPFLGNDFYASMGDLFACHAVDNPSSASELSMLRQYGPDVPAATLNKLVGAFDELRSMAGDDLLNYPYSSRELVHIVKHLQEFPDDGLPHVLNNVFDFDRFTKDTLETVVQVFDRHGVPFGVRHREPIVQLVQSFDLPKPSLLGQAGVPDQATPLLVPLTTRNISVSAPVDIPSDAFTCDSSSARSHVFSEQVASWQLPLDQSNLVSSVDVAGGQCAVASVNPIALHRLPLQQDAAGGVRHDLYRLFPPTRGSYRPRLHVRLLPDHSQFAGYALLHEEMSNRLLLVGGTGRPNALLIDVEDSILQRAVSKITGADISDGSSHWRMYSDGLPTHGCVWLCGLGGHEIHVLDTVSGQQHSAELPSQLAALKSVCLIDGSKALLTLHDNSVHVLRVQDGRAHLYSVSGSEQLVGVQQAGAASLPNSLAPAMTGNKGDMPSRLWRPPADSPHLALVTHQFPDELTQNGVYGYVRPNNALVSQKPPRQSQAATQLVRPQNQTVMLDGIAQLATAIPTWEAPAKAVPKDTDLNHLSGFVHLVDLIHQKQRFVPVPAPRLPCHYSSWLASISTAGMVMAAVGKDSVVTCDSAGALRLWETDMTRIANAQAAWQKMFGKTGGAEELKLELQKDGFDLSKLTEPGHGITDPTGAPHVGGNQFAGGVGGYNTAGLGGIGGPYRLDLGHQVHQMSDEAKAAVPEEIKKKAREVAQRAFKQRLQEIKMSEFDAGQYQHFMSRIDRQVARLKVIVDGLEQKSKERQWIRHQTFGDVDEGKIIEGVTGERAVYRRRAASEPEPGTPPALPKLLRLCVDVSASMYRFNGHDQRMERSLEAALMFMEAMQDADHRIQYEIIGHSGEESDIEFVTANNRPKNQKHRLDVLKQMVAHSQYCMSGDNTLECSRQAVMQLANRQADQRFAIVLSDANLERYGIQPRHLANVMQLDERVQVFMVLIGSLADQAAQLKRALPAGKTFICNDTAELPQIMQTIFSQAMLASQTHDD